MTTAALAGLVAGGLAAYKIVRFALADADLVLLAKGPVPNHALQDKVVWITGSSQGIGEALATEFAAHGARLVLSARRETELLRVKQRLCTLGKQKEDGIVVLPLDVTAGPAAMADAAAVADAAFEGAGVDYLVHNAAAPRPKMLAQDTAHEQSKTMFDVNLFGAVDLTHAALPGMLRRRKGRLVVISSAAGKVPSATQAMYAASKHAVNGYFHSLRFEICDKGLGVTVVCPGPIASDQDNALHKEKDRMSVERCAELIVRAAAHGVDEAWISPHPVLWFMYITQYFPNLANFLQRKIGPKRVRALEGGGKNMYSFNLLVGKSETKQRND